LFGYDDPKLDGLMVLNARAGEKYHEYERLHGEQLVATNRLEVKFKDEANLYSSFRKLAFRLFPGEVNKGIRSQLGIAGKHKDSLDGFIAQLARKERDDLCQDLKTGWSKFKTVCRYLFKENTQYLKILNISVLAYGSKRSTSADDKGEAGEGDPENPPEQDDQLKRIDQSE